MSSKSTPGRTDAPSMAGREITTCWNGRKRSESAWTVIPGRSNCHVTSSSITTGSSPKGGLILTYTYQWPHVDLRLLVAQILMTYDSFVILRISIFFSVQIILFDALLDFSWLSYLWFPCSSIPYGSSRSFWGSMTGVSCMCAGSLTRSTGNNRQPSSKYDNKSIIRIEWYKELWEEQ